MLSSIQPTAGFRKTKSYPGNQTAQGYCPTGPLLLTKGNDGVCSDHRRHDWGASDWGRRLGGRGVAATLRGCYCKGRKRELIYNTPGASPGFRRHPQRITLSALPWSASAEEATMDWIRRKARFSTLAGQSWAMSPKVKIYFTCKENWFCSKNKAK